MNRLFGSDPSKVPPQTPKGPTEKEKVKAGSSSSSSSSASFITPHASDTEKTPPPIGNKKWSLFKTKTKEEPQPAKTALQKFPQEEFDAVAKAIMVLHGATVGAPIASAAMSHMEEIQKALQEDVPNIKKAHAALQKLKGSLQLSEADAEKATQATKTRIHLAAKEPLAHGGMFVDDLADAITTFDRDKFIEILQLLRIQPLELQKALIPVAKDMVTQVRDIWRNELQNMRRENEATESQLIELQMIAKKLENVPGKEAELSSIKEKLELLKQQRNEYPMLVQAIDDHMFTLSLFNIALTLPQGPISMPRDPNSQ